MFFGIGSMDVAQKSWFLDYMGIMGQKNDIFVTCREQIFKLYSPLKHVAGINVLGWSALSSSESFRS